VVVEKVRRLAVVAYPTLSDDDRGWIEGLRARYDPLASRIAAHFTLVFPMEVTEAPIVAQVRTALQSSPSIPVVLRRAAAVPDASGSGHFVFLLAEEGHPELVAASGAAACERIAGQLNDERRIVRARINSVAVIEVGASRVRTVAEIPLLSRGA
jgi:2'-5' RNA ligase superfamily protein